MQPVALGRVERADARPHRRPERRQLRQAVRQPEHRSVLDVEPFPPLRRGGDALVLDVFAQIAVAGFLEPAQDSLPPRVHHLLLGGDGQTAFLAHPRLLVDVGDGQEDHDGRPTRGRARRVRVHRVVAVKVVLLGRVKVGDDAGPDPASLVVAREEHVVVEELLDLRVEAPVELDHRARVLGVLPSLSLLLRLRKRLLVDHLVPHARKVRVGHHHVRLDHVAVRQPHPPHYLRRLAPGDLAGTLAEGLGEDGLDRRAGANLDALLVAQLCERPANFVEAALGIPHAVGELGGGEEGEDAGCVVRGEAHVQLLVGEERAEPRVLEVLGHLVELGEEEVEGVDGQRERADAGEVDEVQDGVCVPLDERGDAVVEGGARAAEPVDVSTAGSELHVVELLAHLLGVVEEVERGVIAEVRAVRRVDALDVHVVLELLAHRGELLAVPVREEHERRAGVEAPSRGVGVGAEELGPGAAAGVLVLLQDGDVVARVREAGRHAEAANAATHDDGLLAVASLRGGGLRGALGDGTANGDDAGRSSTRAARLGGGDLERDGRRGEHRGHFRHRVSLPSRSGRTGESRGVKSGRRLALHLSVGEDKVPRRRDPRGEILMTARHRIRSVAPLLVSSSG